MKNWMFVFFFFCYLGAFSQELLMPDLPETDSLDMEMERKITYQQLLSGTYMSDDLIPFHIPEFDVNAELSKRWSFNASDISFTPVLWNDFFPGVTGSPASFFYHGGSVLNSAAYKVNDRLKLGGYSLGVNPVFTAPLPNQGMNNFDVRSSTIFMQYNISSKFKVETRINVTHGPVPGY